MNVFSLRMLVVHIPCASRALWEDHVAFPFPPSAVGAGMWRPIGGTVGGTTIG